MFHFLGIILFLFLAVLLIGFVVIGKLIQSFLGLGRRNKRDPYTYYQNENSSRNTAGEQTVHNQSEDNSKKRKKIIDDDEGEYVDFEEV